MTGLAIHVDLAGLDVIANRLNALSQLDVEPLLDVAASEVESQTRRRIGDEKTAPDGSRWAGWSEKYGSTRRSGQSLLVNEGDLIDSLHSYVEGDQAFVGSNLVYAAIHQFGGEEVGKNIPARPYLGLSPENLGDLENLLSATLERMVA